MDVVKNAHTAIFLGQTKCGMTHLLLDLVESNYNRHFKYIVIICHTIGINNTYLERLCIHHDKSVFLFKLRYKLEDKSENKLLELIEDLSELLSE